VWQFSRSLGEWELFSRVPELLGFESILRSAGGMILTGETRNIRIKTLSHCCVGQKAEFVNITAGGVKGTVDFKG
jgi:hypothetical protein